MKKILQRLTCCEGAEIAEAALVLPLLFTFIMGIIWFGRAFNIYSTITQAAKQGAVTAARATCATCGNNYASNADVENEVFSVLAASRVDKSQIITYMPSVVACPSPPQPPGGGCATTTNNVTICRLVVLNPSTTPVQCGTVVSFQYPFQFYLPFTSVNLQRILMTAQSQSRMEN